jgi:hypothetical protein
MQTIDFTVKNGGRYERGMKEQPSCNGLLGGHGKLYSGSLIDNRGSSQNRPAGVSRPRYEVWTFRVG